MQTGKLSEDMLKNLVLDRIKGKRKEVKLRPGVGEDCSALDIRGDLCVLSTDPITGAVNRIGSLTVHISCNDVASSGAEPIGILVTILAPADCSKNDIRTIMEDICATADNLNIDVLGGHTEVTDAVNRFVLCGTCVGRVKGERLVRSSGAEAGDQIVMTGFAALEGTSILAYDKEEELVTAIGIDAVARAKDFSERISVVKEGLAAAKAGANSMHDATEGGILGAVWELCEASGKGAVIKKEKIPVMGETEMICSYFGIDPLKLISSGCMIITCRDGNSMVKKLVKKGLQAQVIGEITKDRKRIIEDGSTVKEIHPPGPDELYRVILL